MVEICGGYLVWDFCVSYYANAGFGIKKGKKEIDQIPRTGGFVLSVVLSVLQYMKFRFVRRVSERVGRRMSRGAINVWHAGSGRK